MLCNLLQTGFKNSYSRVLLPFFFKHLLGFLDTGTRLHAENKALAEKEDADTLPNIMVKPCFGPTMTQLSLI